MTELLTLKEAALLLRMSISDIKQAVTQGVALPRSEAIVVLETCLRGSEKVVDNSALERFIERFENEEPGRHPPAKVRRKLLVEAQHKCTICRSDAPRQFHHIIEWAKLKHHDHRHMMVICGTCHDKIGVGEIDRLSQKQYKKSITQKTSLFAHSDRPSTLTVSEKRASRMGPYVGTNDLLGGQLRIQRKLGLVLHNQDGLLRERLVGVATNQSQLRFVDGDGTPDPHQSYVWVKALNLQNCPIDPNSDPNDPNAPRVGTGAVMPPPTEDCAFTENDVAFLERWICCGACDTEPCP